MPRHLRWAWTVRSALHRVGIEVVRHGRHPRALAVYRYRLPPSLDWSGRGGRVEVPLSKVTTAAGFAYEGWHPHVETLHWLDTHPHGADPLDSPLARLYGSFQPTTLREALLDDVADPVPGVSEVPLVRGQLRELWNPCGPRCSPSGRLDQPGLYWGPANSAHVEAEIERTLAIHRRLQREGFRDCGPGKAALSGYLLSRGDDYRFVVHQGHHRLASLAAQGYSTVPVYLAPKNPPLVREDRLERWTRGRRPRYPEATARLLFARLFESDGCDKAERLGLVDPTPSRRPGSTS